MDGLRAVKGAPCCCRHGYPAARAAAGFDQALIATGAYPSVPEIAGLQQLRYLTSDTIRDLSQAAGPVCGSRAVDRSAASWDRPMPGWARGWSSSTCWSRWAGRRAPLGWDRLRRVSSCRRTGPLWSTGTCGRPTRGSGRPATSPVLDRWLPVAVGRTGRQEALSPESPSRSFDRAVQRACRRLKPPIPDSRLQRRRIAIASSTVSTRVNREPMVRPEPRAVSSGQTGRVPVHCAVSTSTIGATRASSAA